jgi:hypothetical protein
MCVMMIGGMVLCGHAEDLGPGKSVFGQHNFIEYSLGELPLIIAAPHGGRLTPGEIPDRTSGVRDIDANTQELARTIAAVVHEQTGKHIHLVICRLHRSKLDANRDLPEASQGNAQAEKAWREHHDFIGQACAAAVKQFGVSFGVEKNVVRLHIPVLHSQPVHVRQCRRNLAHQPRNLLLAGALADPIEERASSEKLCDYCKHFPILESACCEVANNV